MAVVSVSVPERFVAKVASIVEKCILARNGQFEHIICACYGMIYHLIRFVDENRKRFQNAAITIVRYIFQKF